MNWDRDDDGWLEGWSGARIKCEVEGHEAEGGGFVGWLYFCGHDVERIDRGGSRNFTCRDEARAAVMRRAQELAREEMEALRRDIEALGTEVRDG